MVGGLSIVGAVLALADRSARRSPPRASASATPDQVHLSWVGDTSTTMAVTWRTASSSHKPYVVQWGLSEGDYSGGKAEASEAEAPGRNGTIHKAQITGLQPDTTYHYRVAGDGGAWSSDLVFRTAPLTMPATGVTLTVNADAGASSRYPNTGAVLDRIAKENAAFHLIAGDIIYANEDFGTVTEAYFFANDLPRLGSRPVMMAWGNADYDSSSGFAAGTNIGTISRYLQLPGGQANACNPSPYYSFDYAGIHAVALDDPHPRNTCYSRSAMQAWLDQDLAKASANSSVKWKIVLIHRPPFSGGDHGSIVENRFEEFDKYGVDLVVSGHDHSYERSWPLSWDEAKAANSYDRPSYPTYIVAGVGGAPTTTKWDSNSWSAYHDGGKYVGYLRVTATQSSLTGEYIGRSAKNGQEDFAVLDSFTIKK
jgi:acid phosphatase type 7